MQGSAGAHVWPALDAFLTLGLRVALAQVARQQRAIDKLLTRADLRRESCLELSRAWLELGR